jgi:hypothetical protein
MKPLVEGRKEGRRPLKEGRKDDIEERKNDIEGRKEGRKGRRQGERGTVGASGGKVERKDLQKGGADVRQSEGKGGREGE